MATLRGTPTGTRADISLTSFALSHIITAAGTGVDEAAAGTTVEYDVVLGSHPSGDVTVTLVPDARGQLTSDHGWPHLATVPVAAVLARCPIGRRAPHLRTPRRGLRAPPCPPAPRAPAPGQ